ncbi:MAG: sulfate ABC transporter substrate-binding protein [Planctomycetia bacterium]|nr:sulfate ABC transporter substrate-binding protein [Planctomycetia bacterium]
MKRINYKDYACILSTLILLFLIGCNGQNGQRELCNVSYDPTRELYQVYNELFVQHWKEKTGETIAIDQSHGGSGGQSRAVKSGKPTDVVTLALAFDIDDLTVGQNNQPGLINPDWQKRLPNNSCPYISTIVILVRKGNPKGIHDWADLAKPGVKVITPDPKTSGGARWNYLAIWGAALDQALAEKGGLAALNDPNLKSEIDIAQKKAYELTKNVFANAVNQGMSPGARGATDDFVKRGNGDAFLAWENEAILSKMVKLDDQYEIIYPKVSIKAEPPVALVDQMVDQRKTRDIAEEYLNFLYEPEAQEIIAQNNYRPMLPEVAEKYREKYPEIKMFSIDDVFGGWLNTQRTHFNSDGIYDKMISEISQQ